MDEKVLEGEQLYVVIEESFCFKAGVQDNLVLKNVSTTEVTGELRDFSLLRIYLITILEYRI